MFSFQTPSKTCASLLSVNQPYFLCQWSFETGTFACFKVLLRDWRPFFDFQSKSWVTGVFLCWDREVDVAIIGVLVVSQRKKGRKKRTENESALEEVSSWAETRSHLSLWCDITQSWKPWNTWIHKAAWMFLSQWCGNSCSMSHMLLWCDWVQFHGLRLITNVFYPQILINFYQ